MKRCIIYFSVFFAMVSGSFCVSSCTSPNFLWCTSSGIVTYNRHTGQFEMLWESEIEKQGIKHDTVYVCPDSVLSKP